MIQPPELMRLAIEKSRVGIAAGQSPFGCAIARGDDVLAIEHNTVLASPDATAHAEVNAIRTACRSVNDVFLESAIVATTCEPCPMCLAALHWARVKEVYFGATIADAAAAGFNELSLSAADLVNASGSPLKLISGLMAAECRQLFDDWHNHPGARAY